MSRCLSDRTLMRLHAGSGRDAQRAHLTACVPCAERSRRIAAELETVSYILLRTAEPRARVAVLRRSLAPVAAMAATLVAVLSLWAYLAVRPPVAPPSVPAQREEAMAFLRDASFTMFSVHGRATWSMPDTLVADLGTPVARDLGCEWPDWATTTGCDEDAHMERLMNLFERPDIDG
jgi:hypothetical protein